MRTSEPRTIPLTRGLATMVDAGDYAALAQYKWNAHNRRGLFYAARVFERHTISMHREITGCLTGFEVDHINGDTLDNRRVNLRVTDRAGNNRNQRLRKDNVSGFKGVSFFQANRKWGAALQIDHKRIFLGLFLSAENAAIAYNIAALKHFGEYAVLNTEEGPCEAAKPPKN